MSVRIVVIEASDVGAEQIGQVFGMLWKQWDLPAEGVIEQPKPVAAKKELVKSVVAEPKGQINWQKYPARTAQGDLGICPLCRQRIQKGERYYDGGLEGRRAHVTCAIQPTKE